MAGTVDAMKIKVLEKDTPVLLGKGGPSSAGWHGIEKILLCQKEYQYNVVRGIHKPMEYNPDYFTVGSLFHAGRATWFASKFDTSDKTWRRIIKAVREDAEAQKLPATLKAEKQALVYLQEYMNHWKLRPKPRPIACEYLLGPAKLKPDDPFYMFRTAKLDDVGYYPEAGDQLCIGESKTTGASISDCILQYKLHGQPILQFMLWKAAEQGEATYGPVAGTVLDITQKGYGRPSKFARAFIPFEPRVLEWFHKTMSKALGDAAKIDWNTDVHRNIAACTRMGGRGRVECDYQAICSMGRSATTHYVMKDGSSLAKWKPNGEQKVPPWA